MTTDAFFTPRFSSVATWVNSIWRLEMNGTRTVQQYLKSQEFWPKLWLALSGLVLALLSRVVSNNPKVTAWVTQHEERLTLLARGRFALQLHRAWLRGDIGRWIEARGKCPDEDPKIRWNEFTQWLGACNPCEDGLNRNLVLGSGDKEAEINRGLSFVEEQRMGEGGRMVLTWIMNDDSHFVIEGFFHKSRDQWPRLIAELCYYRGQNLPDEFESRR